MNSQLLQLGFVIIYEYQIPIIKKRKNERFKNTLDSFANNNLKFLQNNQNFWKLVLEKNEKCFTLENKGIEPKKEITEEPKENDNDETKEETQ